MARPDVVLLRGTVVGREDSSVYLGISDLMTHGFVHLLDKALVTAQWQVVAAPAPAASEDPSPVAADKPKYLN